MRVARKVAIVIALVTGMLAAGLGAGPVGAQALSITVTPSTGLRFGDSVTIRISGVAGLAGFIPIGTCPPGVDQVWGCDWTMIANSDPNPTLSYVPRRLLRPTTVGAPPIDCAYVACTVGAPAFGGTPALLHPIDFVDEPLAPPALSLDPTPLVDGAFATGNGSGFHLESVEISQCLPGATSAASCVVDPVAAGGTTMDGTLRFGTKVRRILRVPGAPDPVADCGVEACTIAFRSLAGWQQLPITFADPGLSVDVEPIGMLDLTTDEADVRVSVSCTMETPYAVRAEIEQGATVRSVAIQNRRCIPGTPSTSIAAGYASAGGDPYAIGPVTVSFEAVPAAQLLPGDPTTSIVSGGGSAGLIDLAPLVAAIGALMADPANGDLRAAVIFAIRDRVTYDPVFAANFGALLRGS